LRSAGFNDEFHFAFLRRTVFVDRKNRAGVGKAKLFSLWKSLWILDVEIVYASISTNRVVCVPRLGNLRNVSRETLVYVSVNDIEIAKKKLNSRLPLSHQIHAIPKGI
jgi:hypothetical protein